MLEDLKISLGLTTGIPLREGLELASLAEKNNYERIWLGDDILRNELFTYLSIIANKLTRINIGTGILSPFVYSISSIASACATINEIIKNRFILGLGVGGSIEVEKLTGHKPKEVVNKLNRITLVLRDIFKGEKVSYDDGFDKLVDFKLYFSNYEIPIYFGVRGPKLLNLAGKIADGIIFSAPIDILKESEDIIVNSANSCGRDPNSINKVLWNGFIFLDDNKSLNLAKSVVIVILSSLNKDLIKKAKINMDLVDMIREKYSSNQKDAAKKLVDEELIRKFCIFGDLEEIKDQISKLVKIGINEMVIGPPFGVNREKVIQIFNPENLWRK
jgi:5,10-methylenetetrahydromethanopterin reductase